MPRTPDAGTTIEDEWHETSIDGRLLSEYSAGKLMAFHKYADGRTRDD